MSTIDSLRMVLIYAVEFLDIIPDSAKVDPDIAAISQMVAAYDALAPDWSQAPEWAQWCTIDHDGRYSWYRAEPKWTSNEPGEWAYTQRARGEYVSIPIGIDWRLCKWQRPEVAA